MGALSPILRSLQGGLVTFWCPACNAPHAVSVSAQGPAANWTYNGDATAPTFSPSVLVTYNGSDAGQVTQEGHRAPPAVCHSFVTDGRIQFLSDCTHALAGQTVDLPEFPR